MERTPESMQELKRFARQAFRRYPLPTTAEEARILRRFGKKLHSASKKLREQGHGKDYKFGLQVRERSIAMINDALDILSKTDKRAK